MIHWRDASPAKNSTNVNQNLLTGAVKKFRPKIFQISFFKFIRGRNLSSS